MPRINADPNHEVCLSFENDEWEFLRQSMIDAHQGLNPLTGDEAIQRMKEAWARENARKIIAWNAQLEQDRAVQDEQDRLDREAEAAQLAQHEKEAEEQHKEAEKKKLKMNTFDPRRCLGDWIEPRPAQYAINKINNLEWVELDYFTLKGCRDAVANSSKLSSQDTLVFTQLGNTIAMRPLAAMTPSRGIRNDEDLSWLELLEAKNSMLHFIAKSEAWPTKNAEALAAFFVILDVHLICVQTNGRKCNATTGALMFVQWALDLVMPRVVPQTLTAPPWAVVRIDVRKGHGGEPADEAGVGPVDTATAPPTWFALPSVRALSHKMLR
ncbi:hypothetical protein EDB83DRAFT_2527076 [Lactarius deliciosus]|nr:hypothetical protein EDB83DRAFT_2527076 [Lactarius deliciosus]